MAKMTVNGTDVSFAMNKRLLGGVATVALAWAGWLSVGQIKAGNRLATIEANQQNQQRSIDKVASSVEKLWLESRK